MEALKERAMDCVFKRSKGIDQEVHRPGIQVAGEDNLYGAFLRQPAGVFRDRLTLTGHVVKNS